MIEQFPINPLIATLKAITNELKRSKRIVDRTDIADEAEEYGVYIQDLLDSLALLCEEYEVRREENQELTPIKALLKYLEENK